MHTRSEQLTSYMTFAVDWGIFGVHRLKNYALLVVVFQPGKPVPEWSHSGSYWS